MKKEYPVLYKYTEKQQIQQWQVIAEDDHFYTIEGIMGGKLTTSKPTYCETKNAGKKNESSGFAQSSKEAEAKMQKKKDKGYNEVLTDKKNFISPMLAETYEEAEIDWDREEVYAQPKLDGIRALNFSGTLQSREGKTFVSCPHVCQSTVTLDGELYTHKYKSEFNKIVKIVKKGKPEASDLAIAKEKMEYWVYDFPDHEGPFSERYDALKEWFKTNTNPAIRLVPTFKVGSEEELKALHIILRKEGYEGTIVRRNQKNYENKRTFQLLKLKDWVDEEFEIIAYKEGKGGRAGTIGKFRLKHDKDRRNDFDCNVKGNHAYLKEIWENRDSYIGKKATVEYHNRTPLNKEGLGDKPRFGYIIKIDRESYE